MNDQRPSPMFSAACNGYGGYDPDYCPTNKGRRPIDFIWYAVRTNDSCPANQAKMDPRGTFAGWYDDAADRLMGSKRGAICLHGAASAWFQGMFDALDQMEYAAPAHRVVRHLEVAVELGFGEWLEIDGEAI